MLKIVPARGSDPRSTELWLEALAEQGLFPKRLNSLTGSFAEGKPKKLRYSLFPVHNEGLKTQAVPPKDLLELFEASGWSFELYTGEFYLFSSDEQDAPDLFSDEASRAEALKSLQKSIIIRGLVLAALILIPILVAIIYDRIHWSWLPAGIFILVLQIHSQNLV